VLGAATLREVLLVLTLSGAPSALDEALPGPDSPSTKWVADRLVHWPPPDALQPGKDGNPLALECLVTPGHAQTVGVRQVMVIEAPLEDVAAVVEDFAHDAELFPDLADVHKVRGSEDGNRFAVAWEQQVPVFFLPNIRYQTTWQLDRARPGRVSYRYKLKEKGAIKATDGLIVLEAVAARQTRYEEYDFIEADFGPVPTSTAWALTLSGIYRSDVAVKLKLEQPGWTYARIRKEADQLLERFPADGCYERRKNRAPDPGQDPRR